jgi:hypothetical protein
MFTASVVISTVIRSDPAAIAVALAVLYVLPVALTRFPHLQPERLMSGRGMAYFDAHAGQLIAIPWLVVIGALAIAAALCVLAARATERERFF